MLKRFVLLILLSNMLVLGVAQDTSDLTTFSPRTARFTFDYPSEWVTEEENGLIALADAETSIALELDDTLTSGQFKILLAYLGPAQRQTAGLNGTTPDEIIAEVVAGSNITLSNDEPRRYEFNRRLSVRADFSTDNADGAVWVMQMDNDVVMLLQVFTASGELPQIEGELIELLRSVRLTDITAQLYRIENLERPLQFTAQESRLVFNYPEGWTVSEPDNRSALLQSDNVQIRVQFFEYTELSRQGIPIDDPLATLASQQSRSASNDVFGRLNQVSINGEDYPYSRVLSDEFVGLSLGRDFRIGFLWVTLVVTEGPVTEDYGALAWSLLLTTTFQSDPIDLTERVTMPQHQFEFFHPADWLIREVSPSSYLLGTSEAMIDNEPDSLQFTDDAQLIVQYVTATEYGIARSGTSNALEVLQKFIDSASDLTTYDTPNLITVGNFEFAQVDFENPSYSGTALLSPMADGGAVWIQLRTPPNRLGEYEPVALAIARGTRIVTAVAGNEDSSLDEAVFDALGVQPTAIPTPTRRPDAPPDLDDVVQDVVATPVPVTVRELDFILPVIESSYITNISELSINYPAGWLVQETVPISDNPPLYENGIRIANNANLLLTSVDSINEGDVEILVQAMTYAEMDARGLRGDTLFERIQSLVNAFPSGTFDAPLQFLINGELMVLVTSSTPTRQTLTIYRELNDQIQTSAQLIINPAELELWLPTAIAVLQSTQVGGP